MVAFGMQLPVQSQSTIFVQPWEATAGVAETGKIEDAVKSYLFNSQLLTVDSDQMELLCPIQCMNSPSVLALVNDWVSDEKSRIRKVSYLHLDQSMKNGGGPACLRLRAMLSESEFAGLDDRFDATNERLELLRDKVKARYPVSLKLSDLENFDFAEESVDISKAIAGLS